MVGTHTTGQHTPMKRLFLFRIQAVVIQTAIMYIFLFGHNNNILTKLTFLVELNVQAVMKFIVLANCQTPVKHEFCLFNKEWGVCVYGICVYGVLYRTVFMQQIKSIFSEKFQQLHERNIGILNYIVKVNTENMDK